MMTRRGIILHVTGPLWAESLSHNKNVEVLYYWLFMRGNTMVTDEFPSQRASNTETVSMPWHAHTMDSWYHDKDYLYKSLCPKALFIHGISVTNTWWTGMGVTKPISSVPLFSQIFSVVRTHVSYWISRLHLTGVAAAQLRGHLSNIHVIQSISEVLLPDWKFCLRRN